MGKSSTNATVILCFPFALQAGICMLLDRWIVMVLALWKLSCILIILFIDVAEVAGMSMGTRAELQVQMSHAMQLGQAEAPLHVAGRAG